MSRNASGLGHRSAHIYRLTWSAATSRRTPHIRSLAESLKFYGFTTYDALHLACAKQAGVDVFLTTDDKLIKRAQRYSNIIMLNVRNPLSWLQEVLY